MSPWQRMCESGRIKKSSTELRGFSRLTQTPSSFFLLFLSRTSPDFWVRSVVNSHIAQTHEILRVRLCATHKKTKRLSQDYLVVVAEVSILLSGHYHNAIPSYIYTVYCTMRSMHRGVYILRMISLLPRIWLMDSLLADPGDTGSAGSIYYSSESPTKKERNLRYVLLRGLALSSININSHLFLFLF